LFFLPGVLYSFLELHLSKHLVPDGQLKASNVAIGLKTYVTVLLINHPVPLAEGMLV
jgi:hypothetical protein